MLGLVFFLTSCFACDCASACADFVGVAPEQATLWSGLTAVLSVNVVVGIYIYMALQDAPTASQPQPDPAFLAAAQRSVEPTVGDLEARQRQAAAAGTPTSATAAASSATGAASTLTQRRGAGEKKE